MHLAPVSTKYWLENPRRFDDETIEDLRAAQHETRQRRRAVLKRRSSSGKKRRPPKGFRTWRAYMDSIRPNKGGKMARRRRRRRRNPVAVNRPRRRRRRRNPVVAVNRPRRRRRNPVYAANRRRRRRRNPVFATNRRRRFRRNPRLSVKGVLGQAKNAAVCGVQVVAGKVATRVIRNYIPGGKPAAGQALSPTQIAIELGAAVAVGYGASMFLGARAGEYMMAGGFAGVIESLIKTYKVPVAADALGDEGDPNVITVPAHMAGYVREAIAPALSGYVQDSGEINGPGLGAYGPSNASGVVADDSGVFADIGIG